MSADRVRVAVIGAGMSGMCMAIKLKEAGVDSLVVLEKAGSVGGTWRENTYPGLRCDVPAHHYAFTSDPNPDWSGFFAPGGEIRAYLQSVADQHGLREFIEFDTEVTAARWEGDAWRLTTAGGEQLLADVVVSATGLLHHPASPDIPGLDEFAGACFHSAQWEHTVDIAGRKVAIIGTGSTGVQITTAIATETRELLLFQRTPAWIFPLPNIRFPAFLRRLLRWSSLLTTLAERVSRESFETLFGTAVIRPGWQRRLITQMCSANLRRIKDPELRSRLTPDYAPMCKRLVMSWSFFAAMQRPDVELITEKIERVDPRGIVTVDGELHEADVIVLSTGFHAHDYMRPMTVEGQGGLTLRQAWADGPRGYLTVAIPGFPNFFTMLGPNSPLGNASLVPVAEAQAAYITRCIQMLEESGAWMAPTEHATARFQDEVRDAMSATIWTAGCSSYYLKDDGQPDLWPWSAERFRAVLSEPRRHDFAMAGPDGRGRMAAGKAWG
jgi:cation diffusion facilitator CzcD-associated flavoprotein CzcO